MKKILLFLPTLLLALAAIAQPVNDDCNGIIDLGVAPFCPDTVLFNNVGATQSDIGMDNLPPCFVGDPDRDVWFQFVASDTILEYTISVIGCPDPSLGFAPIMNPQVAMYRGDICAVDELVLLDCAPSMSAPGSNTVDLNPPNLTPGITYFLRINDWASAGVNSGAFKLCVKKRDPVFTIEEGGSNACAGQLTDSGGEDGDYANNENNIFTICPDDDHNCINFTLEYFNIENFSDQILIFDGPDINSTPIGALTGSGFNLATNGGVCHQVAASSGCMTIQFISDGTGVFDGFNGFWECTSENCQVNETIEVTEVTDPLTIIPSIVTEDQAIVTIDTIICDNRSIGTFTADNTDLGMDKGLVLSSGFVDELGNPGTWFVADATNAATDSDLNYLSTLTGNGSQSLDACIIELDVFVKTDELTFEYIFGSEEYPEFVNSTFNDIFAFLVSGPGIDGDPNIGNQLNIATLPDGTFIQINSVNSATNWEYYRNNEIGPSVAYDGLTSDYLGVKKSLTAQVDVEPCNSYHLKIAVADRGDQTLDSGVFISEIKGGTPELDVNFFSGIDYLVEDCTALPDELVISIGNPQDDTTTYTVLIGGTATQGLDYTLSIPPTITFLPGQSQFTFPIIPLPDGMPEGTETIEIRLVNDFGCGTVVLAKLNIEIEDNLVVDIFAGSDTAFVCQDGSIIMNVEGAQDYFWTPVSVFDFPASQNPTATPDSSLMVHVVGTLGICTAFDSVYLQIVDPQVDIAADGLTDFCQGDSVILNAVNNVNGAGLTWTPTLGLDDPGAEIVVANPVGNVNYTVTVQLNGCSDSDQIQVNVDPYDPPGLTTTDTLICQNYSVTLADPAPDNTLTTYEWSPSDYLDNPDIPNAVTTPEESIEYTLISSSPNGYCADTSTVNLEVFPADVEVLNDDVIFICLGESVDLEALTSTPGMGLTWTPGETLNDDTLEMVIATPTETTKYYASLVVGACTVIDSVTIVVDSLPDLAIMPDPDKDTYCEGEQILLTSPIFEPANFPNIDHSWLAGPGVQTPDSFLNLVLIAQENFTYIRETTNRACSSTDTIEIIVVPSTTMSVVPADTVICPGDPVQLLVTADVALEEIMWEGNGLSCTTCPDPVATPTNSGTFNYSVEAEFMGCPLAASATVFAQAAPALNFPSDPNLCNGESILLNSTPDPTATYVWTLEDGTVFSEEAAPQATPTQTTTYNVVAMNACLSEGSITINVFENPVYQFPADNMICKGESILINLVEDAGAAYQWTDSSGALNESAPQPTIFPQQTSTIFLNISNPGCSIEDSFVIEVAESAELAIPGDLTICPEELILLNTASTPGAFYEWTTDNGLFSSSEAMPEDGPSTTTTYFVTATFGECVQEEEMTLTVAEDFDLTLPNDFSICNGDGAQVTADVGTAENVLYTWLLNGNIIIEETPDPTFVLPVTPIGVDTITVFAGDSRGCYMHDMTMLLTVHSEITVNNDSIFIFNSEGLLVDFDSSLVCEGQAISLSVNTIPPFESLLSPNYDWLLNSNGVITTSIPESGLFDLEEVLDDNANLQNFTYSVVVTDANGCSDSGEIIIPIFNNLVKFPNAFTPDDDTTNDFFRPVTGKEELPVEEILDFRIYNRWGQMVYDNENGTEGWNGKQNDKPAPSDVYMYYIRYKVTTFSEPVERRGDVTLLR